MRGFLEWLGATPWSVALLESFWVWPLLESTHVMALGLFAGTAWMMDLRLLGVSFTAVPISEFRNRMLPWTRGGFAVMVVTGLLLVYSNPIRYYQNIFFRVKVILLIVAGINVWWFHARTYRYVADWDQGLRPPRSVRMAGAVSLLVWALVVVSGRLIAYNWFDCDIQPQSDFVNWASGCIIQAE